MSRSIPKNEKYRYSLSLLTKDRREGTSQSISLFTFRSFRQNVYVLCLLYITLAFSYFLLISLLISLTRFTTTKYLIF